jgi:AbrB family looped-hinge helix DNA binding protein
MKFARLTSNGRITIPAPLRKKYGLHPGRKIKLEVDDNSIKIIPLVTLREVEKNIGFLETKGKLLKALIKVKKIEREL